jgi:hypothetical protein
MAILIKKKSNNNNSKKKKQNFEALLTCFNSSNNLSTIPFSLNFFTTYSNNVVLLSDDRKSPNGDKITNILF